MLTGFGLSINGKHNYCGDYIYSGHTVSVTISKLTHGAGEPDQSVTDDRFSFFPHLFDRLMCGTAYLFLREYLMPVRCRTLSWKLFNLLLLCMSGLAIVSLLISRGHYLIDILLAYFVTTRVFWIYHTMAYNYTLRVSV
jgi:shingomyelin synthase